jgi:hypothetical protein
MLKSEMNNLKKINENNKANLKIQLKEAKKNEEAPRMQSSVLSLNQVLGISWSC